MARGSVYAQSLVMGEMRRGVVVGSRGYLREDRSVLIALQQSLPTKILPLSKHLPTETIWQTRLRQAMLASHMLVLGSTSYASRTRTQRKMLMAKRGLKRTFRKLPSTPITKRPKSGRILADLALIAIRGDHGFKGLGKHVKQHVVVDQREPAVNGGTA